MLAVVYRMHEGAIVSSAESNVHTLADLADFLIKFGISPSMEDLQADFGNGVALYYVEVGQEAYYNDDIH